MQSDIKGFPGGSGGKESTYNVGDLGSIPQSGRSLEKGMASHSSILAWDIQLTEEPGGLTECLILFTFSDIKGQGVTLTEHLFELVKCQ